MSVQLLRACCCGGTPPEPCEFYQQSGCSSGQLCPVFGVKWLELLKDPPFNPNGNQPGRKPIYFVGSARIYAQVVRTGSGAFTRNVSGQVNCQSTGDAQSLECFGMGFESSPILVVPCDDLPSGSCQLTGNFSGGIVSQTVAPRGFTWTWTVNVNTPGSNTDIFFSRNSPANPISITAGNGFAINSSNFTVTPYLPGNALFIGVVDTIRQTSDAFGQTTTRVAVEAQVSVGPYVACNSPAIEVCPPGEFVWQSPPSWFDGPSGDDIPQSLPDGEFRLSSGNAGQSGGCANCGSGGVL